MNFRSFVVSLPQTRFGVFFRSIWLLLSFVSLSLPFRFPCSYLMVIVIGQLERYEANISPLRIWFENCGIWKVFDCSNRKLDSIVSTIRSDLESFASKRKMDVSLSAVSQSQLDLALRKAVCENQSDLCSRLIASGASPLSNLSHDSPLPGFTHPTGFVTYSVVHAAVLARSKEALRVLLSCPEFSLEIYDSLGSTPEAYAYRFLRSHLLFLGFISLCLYILYIHFIFFRRYVVLYFSSFFDFNLFLFNTSYQFLYI